MNPATSSCFPYSVSTAWSRIILPVSYTMTRARPRLSCASCLETRMSALDRQDRTTPIATYPTSRCLTHVHECVTRGSPPSVVHWLPLKTLVALVYKRSNREHSSTSSLISTATLALPPLLARALCHPPQARARQPCCASRTTSPSPLCRPHRAAPCVVGRLRLAKAERHLDRMPATPELECLAEPLYSVLVERSARARCSHHELATPCRSHNVVIICLGFLFAPLRHELLHP